MPILAKIGVCVQISTSKLWNSRYSSTPSLNYSWISINSGFLSCDLLQNLISWFIYNGYTILPLVSFLFSYLSINNKSYSIRPLSTFLPLFFALLLILFSPPLNISITKPRKGEKDEKWHTTTENLQILNDKLLTLTEYLLFILLIILLILVCHPIVISGTRI